MRSTFARARRMRALAGTAAAAVIAAAGIAQAADNAPKAPQPARHYFVKKGEGAKFDVNSQTPTEVKLTSDMTDGRFTFQDETWKTTFTVPAHYHKEHSEVFYVVSGQLEWIVAGEKQVMNPGDLLYIPPDTVHEVRVVGGKDAHVLFIYEPGGYERYIMSELQYTAEERAKPEIQQRLREMNDFNLAPPQR